MSDDFDPILASPPPVQPRCGFAARVMRQVRAQHRESRGLRFPWGRLAGGVLVALGVIIAAAVCAQHVSRESMLPLMWAVIAGLATVLLVRLMLETADT
jgi:hypothetical protein